MIKKTNKTLDGTSFFGNTITATLADLTNVLGAPHCIGEWNDKVQNEWELELKDGTVFSVYDWKEYRRYSNTDTIEWHVGAHDSNSAYRACEALEEALAAGVNINHVPEKRPNLFQSVKAFINSRELGSTFTTKEFHAAMKGIEFVTGWKKYSGGEFYRSNSYRGYLSHLGFVYNVSRGIWKVTCHIPAWLDSGHVNSYLGYRYTMQRITWTYDVATKTETSTPNSEWEITHTPYKGMTREEIVAKIDSYVKENGFKDKEPEIDHLAEYKKNSKKMLKELATNIIGDGKSPNVLFVTSSAYFMKFKDGEGESFLLEGFDNTESETYGPFYSYIEACKKYDEIELDPYEGIGTVTIEDRKIGVVKEKFLEERITVDYSYKEVDDSHFYNKSK